MILVAATWMGLYLAKRITRPVQMLAAAANEIGAGHLDHRVEPETRDEFGSLIEAFNRMAADLSASRRRLERSSIELEHKHRDVEARRRYVETILERIATGVVSVDTSGRIRTLNSAAARLLGLEATVSGLPVSAVFGSAALKPLAILIEEAARSREEALPQEVAITREGRELHLAVMTTPLRREDGVSDGIVLVFDDVTPLIRAQKVAAWREVARRLAHEIKNPLTPIQLCAERLRRHFAAAPFGENLPVLMALLGVWNVNFLGAATHAVLPYAHALRLLPAYLQQLEMESNGKCVDREDRALDYATAPVLWGAEGTLGQHSFHQLLHQGTQAVPADFVVAAVSAELDTNAEAQAQALAFGTTDASLPPHRRHPGNRPSSTIRIERLDARNLGRLLALYEHKVFAQGVIWNINSFDQWGVELGKALARRILAKGA